jgi:hypothetical protein
VSRVFQSDASLALRRARASVVAAAVLLCPHLAFGGGGPENVAVVVNADSWASLAVANEYIALRRIPDGNIVYLAGLSSNLLIGVDEFRERILKPVLETLAARGLAAQIDCIAYSSDLPYAVGVQSDAGRSKLPRMLTSEASINGLTYLAELVLVKNINYLSLDSNYYFRRRPGAARTRWQGPRDLEKLGKAGSLMRKKNWAEAEPILRELAAAHPASEFIQYHRACCLARLGKGDEALAALGKAVDAGWLDAEHARKDDDLAAIRNRPEFKRLLEKMDAADYEIQSPRAFHRATGWPASGEPVAGLPGAHYLLSTMLAMTSGRGNSVREAIENLRRSAAADGTRPKGTIYYLQNGDIRSTTRQWGFRPAAKKLRQLGVAAEVVPGILPKDKPDVAGAMIGAADFHWKACGSTILPGAICEHLTSFGGMLHEAAGQTPVSELIRAGAAGTSGTVTEPFAIQNKFPTPLVHYFYASGCSLAEAFYQSVAAPYQLLIVGDPLCQPWARIPRFSVEGISAGAKVRGAVTLRPKATGDVKMGRYELYLDGRRLGVIHETGEAKIDSTLLPDGCHELRVVAVAAGLIETQSGAIFPILVDNRGLAMDVGPPPKRVGLDDSLALQAKMIGAKKIVFLQNGRELGAIAGPAGRVALPARTLGLGKVRIQPVAILREGVTIGALAQTSEVLQTSEVSGHFGQRPAAAAAKVAEKSNASLPSPGDFYFGAPLDVEVVPPAPLPAIADRPPQLSPGLVLVCGSAAGVVVEKTNERDWLAKRVKPGQDFRLEGYFEVPSADVYQFQVRTSAEVEILVDSRPLGWPARNRLEYFPVSLGAGFHKLIVKGLARENRALELFFGGPGARSIGGDRFRHATP